jgi:hypothetical protein
VYEPLVKYWAWLVGRPAVKRHAESLAMSHSLLHFGFGDICENASPVVACNFNVGDYKIIYGLPAKYIFDDASA